MKIRKRIFASVIATAFTLAASAPVLAADTGGSPKSANESAGPMGSPASGTSDRGTKDGAMKNRSNSTSGDSIKRDTPKSANETAGPSGGTPPKSAGSMQDRDSGKSGSMGSTSGGAMQDKDGMSKGAPKNANETAGRNNMQK
jgi:hypothetical protein